MTDEYPLESGEPPRAFPVPGECRGRGMTLRDWFAGQALTGQELSQGAPEQVANMAYAIADAMLEARQGAPS